MSLIVQVTAGILAVVLFACLGYLLVLVAAAAWARRSGGADPAGPELPVDIIIPAHDEELVLGATLQSLAEQDYPRQLLRVIVVADNCTDSTAEIAREAGVVVLERVNPEQRGKGFALEWAIRRRLAAEDPAAAFIIVDADTWVAPDFTRRMVACLRARKDARGCCALQGRYGVLNSGDGWRAALMGAAFDLVNHVRPLGADRLGLSVGLKGNGMGFTREVLQAVPWSGESITEDIDFGLDLLEKHGVRVGYVPDARVLAQMPVSGKQAASQRARWEKGRYQLLRQRALPLIWAGLRRRDLRLLDAGASLMVLPLVELGALLLGWGAVLLLGSGAGCLPASEMWYGALIGGCSGLGVYLVGGLMVAGASREAYRALLAAPFYGLWKLALYPAVFLKRSRGSEEWVRTERLAIQSARDRARTRP